MTPLMTGILTAAGAASVVGVAATAAAIIAPGSRAFGPIVCRGDGSRPQVALTFDDGPTPGATERVLDVLEHLRVPAAFFVVGRHVERVPDLVGRMRDDGHLIGNHSFDHPHHGYLRGGRYWREQLARTDELIERCAGVRPTLFRPPLGVKTPAVMSAARGAGHAVVAWSVRSRDGSRRSSADGIVRRVLTRASAGDVILLHDGIDPHRHRDPRPTIDALPLIIDGLRARGLEPVRLDALPGLLSKVQRAPEATPACT